jgi:hypothetical protein
MNMCAGDRTGKASELRDAFDDVSPFIQKHTRVVCPLCSKVCCINKHGDYDMDDLVFVHSLGIKAPTKRHDRKETDPCRFLEENGCALDRWKRPFRCTWYFCYPLIQSMREDNSRNYRAFIQSLRKLISIRRKLIAHSY